MLGGVSRQNTLRLVKSMNVICATGPSFVFNHLRVANSCNPFIFTTFRKTPGCGGPLFEFSAGRKPPRVVDFSRSAKDGPIGYIPALARMFMVLRGLRKLSSSLGSGSGRAYSSVAVSPEVRP
jgi:hypothetical protein